MASHGKKRHTKRIAMPKAISAPRKVKKWMKTTKPGPHSKNKSSPLLSVLRDLLHITKNEKEAKYILKKGEVKIDGRTVHDLGFPVGLMDLIEIPKTSTIATLVFQNSKLKAIKATSAEKLCKITGKKLITKGKTQLNLHDGRNITTNTTTLKTGDSIKISVPKQEIKQEIKLEKGVNCYVSSGRHSGKTGNLIEIIEFAGSTKPNAKLKAPNGTEFITLKDYVFAVDDKFTI